MSGLVTSTAVSNLPLASQVANVSGLAKSITLLLVQEQRLDIQSLELARKLTVTEASEEIKKNFEDNFVPLSWSHSSA